MEGSGSYTTGRGPTPMRWSVAAGPAEPATVAAFCNTVRTANGGSHLSAAVRGLTEALELEWRRHGIRVIDMWPLFVATGMVDGVETASTASLGVHLGADEVAAEIYAATRPGRHLLPRVHHPVGRQATVLAAMVQVTPNWVQRLMNKTVTHT